MTLKLTVQKSTISLVVLVVFLIFSQPIFSQESPSVLYVPLIGLTSVPKPLALPNGPGLVTYNYAVKNFLNEVALSDIQVVDDTCSPIKYVTGDEDGDTKLDYNETWRFSCTVRLSQTTQSTAVAKGTANNIVASHRAHATVIVGSDNPAPLISIINITKVAYPLSLPREGGNITFTYKVNNPGVVPLGNVTVTDDKCTAMSGKLGDTNGNNQLDVSEVWIYTCTTNLKETTTNTVQVTAFANGLSAVGDATITVKVDDPVPNLPNVGVLTNMKIAIWKILFVILLLLIIRLVANQRKRSIQTKPKRIKQ